MDRYLTAVPTRFWFQVVAAAAISLVAGSLVAGFAVAAEHRLEALNEPAPDDAISPEQFAELNETGVRVVRGTGTELCDIWFRKNIPAPEGFTPSLAVQFPFKPGEFVGVIRYHRRGEDYRGQQIPKSVYVLRTALQPVDGNHVGTSDTRDFFLLLKPDGDRAVDPMNPEEMFPASAASIESSHPAMLALKLVPADGTEETPSMHYDELHDLWLVVADLSLSGRDNPLRIGLVVAGHAAEQ
jgi:hypothetical protein